VPDYEQEVIIVRTFIVWLAALAMILGVCVTQAQQEAKMKVLILSSETGHPYPQTTPVLCQFLLNAGMDVELTYDLAKLNNLTNYDVVVFNGRYQQRNEAAEKALINFVEGGKGLVVIHISSNSFSGSEEWKKLVGRVWVSGVSGHPPFGPFKVTVTDSNHPIMRGIKDFTTQDEMYQKLDVSPDEKAHVLATATDGQRTDPMAFTLEHGSGRVFHTTLGHAKASFQTPEFQKMIVQGVQWAARKS
jgi:hypothetical protein